MQKIKQLVASFLGSSFFGRAITFFSKDTIPSLRGEGIFMRNSPGISRSVKAHFFFGMYESGEMKFIKQFLPSNENVIELGSSLGIVSSYINKHKSPRKLILVEANPKLMTDLRENLVVNRVPKYVLYNQAIGNSGTDSIQFIEGSSNTTGSVNQNDSLTNKAIMVPVITLSEIIEENGIDSYVLVCDIEGSETCILNDANNLAGCKMFIMELHETVEHGRVVTVPELKKQVMRIGFEILGEHGPLIAAVNTKCYI
jgi:FkbM family methyltransferase